MDSYSVTVAGGPTHIINSLLRALFAVPLLMVSLVFYLGGIILSITIIGAIVGIPMIVTTYAIDVLALALLINIKEKIHRIRCPKCRKTRWLMLALKEMFICKKCGSRIDIIETTP